MPYIEGRGRWPGEGVADMGGDDPKWPDPASSREPAPSRVPHDPGDALERAFREHFPAVYRRLYARVRNAADAEDLTSQVFLKAVRWLDGGRTTEEVRAWLFRCAATVLAEHWRQHYRRQSALRTLWDHPAAGQASGGRDPNPGTSGHRVEAVLAQLPSRYGQVLRLRFLEGRTPAEIARAMGLRLEHVRVLQYRALRAAARLRRADDGPAT